MSLPCCPAAQTSRDEGEDALEGLNALDQLGCDSTRLEAFLGPEAFEGTVTLASAPAATSVQLRLA
jgi:hypothetical protein